MKIDIVSDAVQLTFPELSGFEASDNMVIGEFRGRKTSFSSIESVKVIKRRNGGSKNSFQFDLMAGCLFK